MVTTGSQVMLLRNDGADYDCDDGAAVRVFVHLARPGITPAIF